MFPLTVRTEGPNVSIHGCNIRTYAAIHLGVPQSEHDWLNDMIRESQRNELAKAVMPLLQWSDHRAEGCAKTAFAVADAMLAEQEKK